MHHLFTYKVKQQEMCSKPDFLNSFEMFSCFSSVDGAFGRCLSESGVLDNESLYR